MKEKFSIKNLIKTLPFVIFFLNMNLYAIAAKKWSEVTEPDKVAVNMDKGFDKLPVTIIVLLLIILIIYVIVKIKNRKIPLTENNTQLHGTEKNSSMPLINDKTSEDKISNKRLKQLCEKKLIIIYNDINSDNILLDKNNYIDISQNVENLDIFNEALKELEELITEISNESKEYQIAKDGYDAAKENPSFAGVNAIIGTLKQIIESLD